MGGYYRHLPHLAETNTPRSTDVADRRLLYDGRMRRVFLADARSDERSDLRLLLVDIDMQVVGEAAGWTSVLNLGPTTHPDVVVVDWGLISTRSVAALRELQIAYPTAVLIVVPGLMDAHQRSMLIAGTDDFIHEDQLSNRWARQL